MEQNTDQSNTIHSHVNENTNGVKDSSIRITQSTHKQSTSGGWFGLILIVAGFLLLLNTFELLHWSVWNELWRFWPLLFVFWGMQILLGKTWLANLVMIVFVGLVMFFILLYSIIPVSTEVRSWVQNNFSWIPQTHVLSD